MALRLVQRGEGNPRPLVLGFLLEQVIDKDLRAALGPTPCIVADGEARGPMLPEMLEFAHKKAGLEWASRLALIGYSAGCQRVRALRLAGAAAHAYLLADGTHASWPPEHWQIEWLRELAEEARQGHILLVASHTLQSYTEQLPQGKAFASTLTVLREATRMPLRASGTLDMPVVSRDGELWVYSYASQTIDRAAHIAQGRKVVPFLAAQHLRKWLVPDGKSAGAEKRLPLFGLGMVGLAAIALTTPANSLNPRKPGQKRGPRREPP